MSTTSTLANINVLSQSAFSNVVSTSDDTLYFVEEIESIPTTPMNTLSTSGTVTLTDNSVNQITPSAAVTFSLPTVTDATIFHQILVQVNMSTVKTITLGTAYYFNKTAPSMSTVGQYNLIYEYDNANSRWVVGCVAKGTAS